MKKIGLYVHVPFCTLKCPYCNFYSIPNAQPDLIGRYVSALCSQIEYYGSSLARQADTLYFGGGTPSLLDEEHFCRVIETARKYFALEDAEITVEMNPNHHSNLQNLCKLGVNRLSVGMQSANNSELLLLGRNHTSHCTAELIDSAKQAGFKNISLDVMLATPFQTAKSLKETLLFCKSKGVQHVSAYLLKIEEGTPYFSQKNNLYIADDIQARLYLFACEELEKLGFKQYEISNFSLSGFKSRHNLKYWNCQEYLGLGPSAHSFISGKRFYCKPSLECFFKSYELIYDCEGGSEEEYCMLKMRLSQGLSNWQFRERFGHNIPQKYFKKAKIYQKHGLIKTTKNSIKFTQKGFLLSNRLIANIF